MSVEQGQSVRPLDLMQDLTPSAIEAFLRVSGWQQADLREGVSAIWQLPEAHASLMLPYDTSFRDFPNRLRDALQTISEVYDIRNTETLALEIIGAQSDIILLRADGPTFEGSIPLTEAQGLLNGARKMLLAAACSAIQPRPSFRGRKPDAALDFVAQEVRFGHTSRGSFVLTLIVRHESTDDLEVQVPDSDSASLNGTTKDHIPSSYEHPEGYIDESYSRRVMTTLATGLKAANDLLQDEPNVSLEDAVQNGASAELLSSIEEMGDHPGVRALDISFLWSPVQPSPPGTISSRVVFPRPDRERIQAVRASMLKQPTVSQEELSVKL